MSETTPDPSRVQGLEPSITYKRDGISCTITMTMGLLNKLLQGVGNYANVGMVGVDPFFNEIILKKIMTLRDHKGRPINALGVHLDDKGDRIKELEDLADVEVTPDDAARLLLFCQAHMVDFMIRGAMAASKLSRLAQDTGTLLSAATPGSTGSQGSTSATPAA